MKDPKEPYKVSVYPVLQTNSSNGQVLLQDGIKCLTVLTTRQNSSFCTHFTSFGSPVAFKRWAADFPNGSAYFSEK